MIDRDPARRPADPVGDLLAEAGVRLRRYLAQPPDAPVSPSPEAVADLAELGADLPADPTPAAEVIERLDRLGSPATMRTTGGRYFGFVTGGALPVTVAAAILATAWDQNAARPEMSPVAARLDEVAARWVCQLLGLPAEATGGFCAGASVANLTCILAGRDALAARAGWDIEADGLHGAPPIPVVTSSEVHVSVLKALRAAGIGRRAVTFVDTDDRGRLDLDRLPALAPGTLVIAQAGNVNTGHTDPLGPLADRVAEVDGWLHVDGAFGLWAAASPRLRTLVEGAERADSWATDAHKWLNVPYDSAIAICARGADLRRAMTADAPYLGPDDPDDDKRIPMQLGLQMSQRARAVEVWAAIATLGRSGVATLVERSCDQAVDLADRLAAGGAEILAPVVLNQALVAFGDDTTTDAVIDAVQRDGTCWVGPTTWQGRRAMRLSVSSAATTNADIEASASAILACAAEVGTGTGTTG